MGEFFILANTKNVNDTYWWGQLWSIKKKKQKNSDKITNLRNRSTTFVFYARLLCRVFYFRYALFFRSSTTPVSIYNVIFSSKQCSIPADIMTGGFLLGFW